MRSVPGRSGSCAGADALAELVAQHEAYAAHDDRFWPARVVELVGELCARCDAIRSEPPSLPQLFVRGAPSDEGGELGSARLLGLGCEARTIRGGTDPLAAVTRELCDLLADLVLLGLRQTDAQGHRAWQDLRRRLEALGFTRLAEAAARLACPLDARSHSLH